MLLNYYTQPPNSLILGFMAQFCLELLMQCKDLTAGSDPVINGAASPLVEAQLLGPALRGNELEIEGRGTVGP